VDVLWLLLAALVAGGGWLVYVRLYPWRDCPRCHGARRNRFGYAHRDCKRCGSTGRVRRLGAPGEER
jgi:DnaJ-class molecular chaperone